MTIILLITIGVAAGILSGFFGIGGGVLIVPALVYIIGFSQHKANGTSLAVLLLPIGLAACIEYFRMGQIDIKAAAIIAVSLIISSWVASFFALKTNEYIIRISFGIFLSLLGLWIVITNINKFK